MEIATNKHNPEETLCLAGLRELALRASRIPDVSEYSCDIIIGDMAS